VLTRCPSCATHFRVTPEQLKARSGRVRCGQCQNVFNALDSLIEEPLVVAAPLAAVAVPPAPTFEEVSGPPQPVETAAVCDNLAEAETEADPARPPHEVIASSEPPFEAMPETPAAMQIDAQPDTQPDTQTDAQSGPIPELPEPTEAQTAEQLAEPAVELPATLPVAEPLVGERVVDAADAAAETTADDWSSTFPEPPPPPRRWPWVIGSVFALFAIVLQAALAFRVELVVLWPEAKPALVALCEIADCEVGLPAKVSLVGIEASDLHPDSEHKGRLVLAATLKSRAPFAQQFPHLELTLTDTADQAIARKVLAPADYLPPATPVAGGMRPNADIMVTIGIDAGEMTASGYRLYLFYP
jgi:predicted Zn finger-like uncharacterized protein